MTAAFGFAHFLSHADGVSTAILLILLAMSVATWYLILTKATQRLLLRRQAAEFLRLFWNAPNLGAVAARLHATGVRDPFSHLLHHGLTACEQYRRRDAQRLIESGSADEFLTRALKRAIAQDTARLERGLTLLASIGSSAPFVGLFGTVWGIYHALLAIGMSGQGTLDKVAGPVGEALLMTAMGLAVAIPAVLAYNFFTRGNRAMLAELDSFAHDVFAFLSLGIKGAHAFSDPSPRAFSDAQPLRARAEAAGA